MAGTTHNDGRAIVDALKVVNDTLLTHGAGGLATETTLLAVKTAVENIDISIDNIELDADTINLNTDTLEALQTTSNTNTSTTATNTGTIATNTGNTATSLAIMDDWDESDRAKVNPVVGQAGIQGGAGAVSANTQRVVIATDQTVIPTSELPDATSTYAPSSDISAALEASSVTKAGAGVIYGISGHNTGPAQFILFYNTTSVPVNGAVTPVLVLKVASGANFSLDTGKFGMFCSVGICWSNSIDASPFTKTLGAADCFANVQYK